MSNAEIIQVFDIVGSGLCVSSDDGLLVYNKIVELLRQKQKIIISFEDVEILITAFLNAAIGQLYSEFTEECIKENLSVINIKPQHKEYLKLVVENAKIYFKNREKFDEAWKAEVSDEE